MSKVRQPLSLKKQGEAIEQAGKLYYQGSFKHCAEFLVRTSPDPVVAPIDILAKIIHCRHESTADETQKIVIRKIAKLKSELPHDQHLMLVLTKEIEDCSREKFGEFLLQAKSANARAQLKEAMPEHVFQQMLASLQLGSADGEEVVEVAGGEGKEDSDSY
jgi:hypothetical protein